MNVEEFCVEARLEFELQNESSTLLYVLAKGWAQKNGEYPILTARMLDLLKVIAVLTTLSLVCLFFLFEKTGAKVAVIISGLFLLAVIAFFHDRRKRKLERFLLRASVVMQILGVKRLTTPMSETEAKNRAAKIYEGYYNSCQSSDAPYHFADVATVFGEFALIRTGTRKC